MGPLKKTEIGTTKDWEDLEKQEGCEYICYLAGFEEGLSRQRLWGCECITQAISPLVHTGPLIHIQGQRTPSTVMWKFHWLHRFHQLETRIIILIQKYFPISSAMLWTGLFSHRDELSWPSRSYLESFSFCLQWTLLTNTLLFKCSNSVPFPIQCPLHWDLQSLSCYILSLV